MCGITGIYHFDKERKADKSLLKKMNDTLYHRGPDGEGYFIKDNVGLAHRRLSIIDLQTGEQPIFNSDKSLVIIMNGEIYNYIELKKELQKKGYLFHTESDTEVALIAYQHWGTACFNKFNGMWAIAIWDNNRNKLVISRDRIGEKPLYYYQDQHSFVFGSEIKSLFAFGIPKQPRYELLEIYLCLGRIPAPHSFYNQVYKLEPGKYIEITPARSNIKTYWKLPEIDEPSLNKNTKQVHEEFEFLIEDSVRIRMRADVPFGAFLSGGLDSSCITSLMSQNTNQPVKTFTLKNEYKDFDESQLARMVSDKFSTNHHELMLTPDTLQEALNKVAYHYDEPFGDSSAIPTGYISKLARQHVKMALTGDGGDEVLSGYNSYKRIKQNNQFKILPSVVYSSSGKCIAGISHIFKGKMRYNLNRISTFLNSIDDPLQNQIVRKYPTTKLANIKDILNNMNEVIAIEDFIGDFFKPYLHLGNFYQQMYFHLKLTLPDGMLVKVDRMSMAYSLETRIPFLDHRIIELLMKTHMDVKMKGLERKSVLRNTVAKKLPEPLLAAGKKGFSIPMTQWFINNNNHNELSQLSDWKIGLNNQAIEKMVNKNQGKIENNGNFIWTLMVLQKILNF
ncbi:MAG: asparagine synthase (glutamine-hydrolyzing) [Bacteroidales bacterium]|nr:asparagine synthase (glutamine-hydrolyzing) [Bacteroidales bacterium]